MEKQHARRDYCGKREAGRSCQATITTSTSTSVYLYKEVLRSILPSYDKLPYTKSREASTFCSIIRTYFPSAE